MLSSNRDTRIDILRGIALVGIILVNVNSINSPAWMHSTDFAFQSTTLDNNIAQLIFNNLVKKTYPIFAFLFGYSCSIVYSKKNEWGTFIRYWYKRCLILFILGVLNVTFIWWGDILINYAMVGLLLPIFLRLNGKILPTASATLLLLLAFIGTKISNIHGPELYNNNL